MSDKTRCVCKYCGHEWETFLFGYKNNLTCDKCKSSGEYYVWTEKTKDRVNYYEGDPGTEEKQVSIFDHTD